MLLTRKNQGCLWPPSIHSTHMHNSGQIGYLTWFFRRINIRRTTMIFKAILRCPLLRSHSPVSSFQFPNSGRALLRRTMDIALGQVNWMWNWEGTKEVEGTWEMNKSANDNNSPSSCVCRRRDVTLETSNKQENARHVSSSRSRLPRSSYRTHLEEKRIFLSHRMRMSNVNTTKQPKLFDSVYTRWRDN